MEHKERGTKTNYMKGHERAQRNEEKRGMRSISEARSTSGARRTNE